MRFLPIILGLTLLAAGAAPGAADSGDSVVVVYNSQMPGSKAVAGHYAARRHVPENQVLAVKISTNEVIGRVEYQEQLETPLRNFLEEQKLLVMEPDTGNSHPDARRVKEARIRYIVLCYGVPLKIGEEPKIVEPGEDRMRSEFRRNGAAIDSELCLLPWPDPHRLLAGFQINPLYNATNPAVIGPARGLLMVTRLDGPDAATANGLVDKAMDAERDGLWGRAYFDLQGITNGPMKLGDEWIATAAKAAFNAGFETVVDDKPEVFSAGFPMSHIALYAGWYKENVSGPFAQPKVEFMPGAFAYHLHSYSARTLRSTSNNWCGPLLAKGATATMGCVEEPYLTGTPNIGIFFQRWLTGFTFGEAAYASQGLLSWQTTFIGDPLYRPFGKAPRVQDEELVAEHSPLLQWSHLRFVNMGLIYGVAPARLLEFLQKQPETAASALLTEKMGDLYQGLGQPGLAIESWQQALQLNPSPQQTVRLTLRLGDKLIAAGREEQALSLYDNFLKSNPAYPEALPLYEKMKALADKLNKHSQSKHYEKEIARLTQSPDK